MENNSLYCISPLDGRYTNYTSCLKKYFSEFALFKYRLMIEIEYLIYLKSIELPELKDFPNINQELKNIYKNFSHDDCIQIKNIEFVINHDVKAVEYFLAQKLESFDLHKYKSFIHFGLTSQDINNNSITLSIKNCIEEIIIPKLEDILANLLDKSLQWSEHVMLSHTHGQSAVQTTMGKEIKVFHYRISKF